MNNIDIGQKIMVMGSSGSGKTFFSLQLGKILKLPVIHLDKEYWKPGWIETPKEEWIEKQKKLVENEHWIIDGNFSISYDIRFQKANTVVLLDYNRFICLYGIFKRWTQNFKKTRKDMAEGCIETMDFEFIKYVWNFPEKSRKRIMNKFLEYENINKIIFKNRKEAKLFLKNIEEKIL